MFISTQDMATRRKQGYDIGNAYLSSASKVYHFDTDIYDQNGNNDLTITDATGGTHNLVGAENQSDDIDFTPAILAIAPYSTIGRSLYGQYSLAAIYGACVTFTVDFWLQYIYAENQIIFEVGNAGDKIKLVIAAAECYFEKGTIDPSGIPFNAEIAESRLYIQLQQVECEFNKASAGEIAFNAQGSGENCPFESIAKKEYNNAYKYYTRTESGGVEVFTLATVSANSYYAMLKDGLWEKTIAFNSPEAAHSYLQHDGQTQSEQRELADVGVTFTPNSWLHMGIIASPSKIIVAMNDRTTEFTRYETASAALSVTLNSGKNSFMLDELMIDTTAAEPVATFYEHTQNRVPWANLSKSNDYFILTVKELANFKTNIFDTQLFKDKVAEVIQDYINNN
jgi:hypothetical protein